MPSDLVLLTRPQPDSDRVADLLAGYGIASVIWPLTQIVPAPDPIDLPPETDGLVFTSRNGVSAFAALSSRRDLPAWCVGDRTAAAAREVGFGRVHSAGGDVRALVRLLRDTPPAHLAYLSGQHVSADLAELLAGSGHRIESHVIYSAEAGGPPPPAVERHLAKGHLGAIALWSRRAANVFESHLTGQSDWQIGGTVLVAISERAAQPLATGGFRHISIAEAPTGSAMIDAIRAAMRK